MVNKVIIATKKVKTITFDSFNEAIKSDFKALCLKMNTNTGISESLCLMPYSQFLQTDYWKFISNYKKHLANRLCQHCRSTKKLEVHHTTYAHLGYEYLHLSDLIVLCHKCHKKEHIRLRKAKKKQ